MTFKMREYGSFITNKYKKMYFKLAFYVSHGFLCHTRLTGLRPENVAKQVCSGNTWGSHRRSSHTVPYEKEPIIKSSFTPCC